MAEGNGMRKLIFLILCSTAIAQNPYRIFYSFNAGELSPLLTAREDLAKYQSGCSIMENLIPIPQGGAQKRPGTKYIIEVKTSSLATRILPFEFSTSQSYIIEAGNQYMRFCADGAQLEGSSGTEDLSGLDNLLAHWTLNDNAASTTVDNDEGTAGYDGTASANTNTITATGVVSTCFDFESTYYVTVADNANFTFQDGGPNAWSIALWAYITDNSGSTKFISKWTTDNKEWVLGLSASKRLIMNLYDESEDINISRKADTALSNGWRFIVMTYDSTGGATAANGITFYVDGAAAASTATNNAGYVAMENKAADVIIGAMGDFSQKYNERIDNVAIFSDVLISTEVAGLYTSAVYEITTPYLTADLFDLRYEQSADVLYITHPDYETRKLSRIGNMAWTMTAAGYENGPFRTQNIDEGITLACSATTGSALTLTAVGGSVFSANTAGGHIPSGSADTSKSQTGALFKLVHPFDTTVISPQTLTDNYTNSQVENTSWMDLGTLYEGAEWSLVTTGTWTGTFEIQRNYTIGAAHGASGWEKVLQYKSVDDKNVSTTGTQEVDDASYRAILVASGDAAEACAVAFSTDQYEHIGIVEITAVTSPTVATCTVLTTLGSTDATHKWAEGSWSNYRGWPRTVAFFEDRLTFGGNIAQPDTVWASVSSDYGNMEAGADDDDALLFTLSSRQVNVIEWIIGKDKLLIGTSGAEWTIAGGTDEPLTPSNPIVKQHSTYGSANLQAVLANESVLFFQRGAEKMRELAYNWELDSYVAPDMTILSNLIADSGIVDTAFQKTPDSILWCVRNDGELPVFSYERKENVTAWSRMVTQTNLAGTLSDSDFESIAVISGSTEDEVWVVVERTMAGVNSGNPVRYIEQFQPRDFGDDADDAFYVDAGVTYDSDASSAMTGLDHLEGETVYVLADGVMFDTAVVSGGAITLKSGGTTTTASTVQMGLGYETHLRTMPLSWIAQGTTIHGRIKRISEVIARWYVAGDFSIGRDADTLQTMSISGQTSSIDRLTFPPGYDRDGYVYIYQQSPEPLTLLALMIEFDVQ